MSQRFPEIEEVEAHVTERMNKHNKGFNIIMPLVNTLMYMMWGVLIVVAWPNPFWIIVAAAFIGLDQYMAHKMRKSSQDLVVAIASSFVVSTFFDNLHKEADKRVEEQKAKAEEPQAAEGKEEAKEKAKVKTLKK